MNNRNEEKTSELPPEDRTFLDESRYHYESLQRTGTVTKCNLGAMFEVMKFWEPDVRLDRTDANDIAALIRRLYMRYDRYLAQLPKEKPAEPIESIPEVKKKTRKRKSNP